MLVKLFSSCFLQQALIKVRDSKLVIYGLMLVFLMFANVSVQAADEFWQSPSGVSTVRVADNGQGADLSFSNHSSSYHRFKSDGFAAQHQSLELNRDVSSDSALAFKYSQARQQTSYMFGYTHNKLSVSLLSSRGENFSELADSYTGIDPYVFHAGLQQKFRVNGYAVDYSLGRFGHMQYGQAKVSANGLSDRQARYFQWSGDRLFARTTQFDRDGGKVGNGFDAGFAFGANKQVAYQSMRLDNGASLNRIRLQLNGNHSRQYWLDLSSHRNPLYRDNDGHSIMFSFKTILGAKKLVNYASEPTVTGAGEDVRKLKKRSRNRLKLGLFIGVGVAAGAVLASSGDSERDDSNRFNTQHSAARDLLNRVNPLSIQQNVEYGGWVVRNADGSYSPTGTTTGDNQSVRLDSNLIPAGTTETAIVHTHAAFDPEFDNENFSETDKELVRDLELDGYLGTPGGQFKFHDYETDTIVTLGSIATSL